MVRLPERIHGSLLLEIPPEKAGVNADKNEVDPIEFRANPEDRPEDPSIFIIISNNEEV